MVMALPRIPPGTPKMLAAEHLSWSETFSNDSLRAQVGMVQCIRCMGVRINQKCRLHKAMGFITTMIYIACLIKVQKGTSNSSYSGPRHLDQIYVVVLIRAVPTSLRKLGLSTIWLQAKYDPAA